MKRSFLSLFILMFFLGNHSLAFGDVYTDGRDTVAQYIKNLQYADNSQPGYGAIRKSLGPTYYDGNVSMYKVEPYFTHIACIALLSTSGNDDVVEAWMNWYIDKAFSTTAPYYKMVNYYYDKDGNNETSCPPAPTGITCNYIDAQDSDPVMFFLLAYKYLQKGNNAWFTASVKQKLEGGLQFIYESLFNSAYGMTIASTSYPVYYTMDNSEVYAGLTALLKIEQAIYGAGSDIQIPGHPGVYLKANMIDRIKFEMLEIYKLYPLPAKTNLSYLDYRLNATVDKCDGLLSPNTLYDVTPTIWPVIFGIDTDFNSVSANFCRTLINNAFPNWKDKGWPLSTASNNFWDTSVGYYFSMSGNPDDQALGKLQAGNALSETYYSSSNASSSCYVADAGWLLLNLGIIINGGPSNAFKLYN